MSTHSSDHPPTVSPSPELNARSPFFTEAGYQATVDEIVHLCQFGNSLVALLGDKGIGKSTLLLEAEKQLKESSECCYLSAKTLFTIEDLLNSIISEFSVKVSPEASAGEMLVAIRQFVPTESLKHLVIIIDDADLLSDKVLSSIVSLLQGQQGYQLHLLIAGVTSLGRRLDQFEMNDLPIYDIPLEPLDLTEFEQYLAFRLDGLEGYDIATFDEERIKQLWQQSKGIPENANASLNQFIISQELSKAAVEEPMVEKSTSKIPYLHMGLLVALLTLLILGLIYLGSGSDEPKRTEVTQPSIITEPAAQPDTGNAAAVVEAPSIPETPDVQSLSPQVPVDATGVSASPVADANSPQANTQPQDQPSASADLELKSTPSEPVADAAQTAPATPAPTTPAVKPTVSKPDISKPEASTPKVSKPELKVAEPTPAATQSAAQITSSSGSVNNWDPAHFVLQVTASGSKAGIDKFVDRQPNKGALTVTQQLRNGKPWYVVVAGPYPTRGQALSAINKLPQTQVNAGPWPRTVGSLK